jgi:hypothetical protein
MICGHCRVAFRHDETAQTFANDQHHSWSMSTTICPECGHASFRIYSAEIIDLLERGGGTSQGLGVPQLVIAYPMANSRPPCPPEVPSQLSRDYEQACRVLFISPEASAALSRRCLQGVLRDKGYPQKDLVAQIQAALDSRTLPTQIGEVLDAVRNIGNFAAHPTKSQSTGEIMEVEPGEAEWNLEVLEALFDFYYVLEAANRRRMDALNARLADAGKPPLKGP